MEKYTNLLMIIQNELDLLNFITVFILIGSFLNIIWFGIKFFLNVKSEETQPLNELFEKEKLNLFYISFIYIITYFIL